MAKFQWTDIVRIKGENETWLVTNHSEVTLLDGSKVQLVDISRFRKNASMLASSLEMAN